MSNQDVTLSESEQKKEDWMNAKWRPMMGWMYMTVCACDFMLFPVLWSLHQALNHGSVSSQWQPLTLQGAGLFHIAMGAVLGLAAYGRTQEKLAGANNGGLGAGTTYTPPASSGFGNQSFGTPTPVPVQSSFSSPAPQSTPSSFGGGFGSSTPEVNTTGKKVVPTFGQPEL